MSTPTIPQPRRAATASAIQIPNGSVSAGPLHTKPPHGHHALGMRVARPKEEHLAIRHGIKAVVVTALAASLGLSADDLANRCGLSRATFQRRLKEKKLLDEFQSDALARYARLVAKAQEVFEGDEAASRTWLHTAQPGLGNEVPIEFARTSVGYREVENLLTRIDLGVYA